MLSQKGEDTKKRGDEKTLVGFLEFVYPKMVLQ
jgi:hypothetical protein